jgi:acetyl-CoA carboxylase biotin carboxyl carrier protein
LSGIAVRGQVTVEPTASRAADPQRPTATSGTSGWLADLRAIIAAFEASDATELELRTPPLRIALRRQTGATVPPAAVSNEEAAEAAGLVLVRCPLTGVWYEAPSPGASAYVRVGDRVEIGTTIGVIETMKVFNEVTSDAAGVIRQILVHDRDLVTVHAPLLALEASDALPVPPRGA